MQARLLKSAPEGQQIVAPGVSLGDSTRNICKPRKGRQNLSPLRGCILSVTKHPGLTSGATFLRPRRGLREQAHELSIILCTLLICLCATFAVAQEKIPQPLWSEVIPNVWRTESMPHGYALVSEDRCLMIGVPPGVTPTKLPPKVSACDLVVLTHHHRDSCANARVFVAANISVRAPKLSEQYLSPAGVAAHWDKSIPRAPKDRFPTLFERYWGDWTYLVHPTGIEGMTYDIADGTEWTWHNWNIKAIPTPGHSKDHTAYLAEKSGVRICFAGDAIAGTGKIWSPYTVEWHHQQDAGAVAAALSLRTIAAAKPTLILPEHADPIRDAAVPAALLETADHLERLGAAKNYDKYTKSRSPVPEYRFLAPDQVGTANPQGNPVPWTKLSPHLFLSGNIYALASRDGPVLLMDAYSQNVVERVDELKRDHGFGPVEVVMISHAHNDHYTGIFALPRRDSFQVWTLDKIADVVDDPHKYLAPYVDPRIPNVNRRLRDGETVRWHEYELKIHHLPGQTLFGLGVETTVDGHHVIFTGDNFYHHEQYSGGGGWSGRNRGLPLGYARSAEKILAMQPDWILAEHGGAFEFNPEDFRRRRDFARQAADLADRLSPSGDHRIDWDPQRVRIEPLISAASRSKEVLLRIAANNPSSKPVTYVIRPARTDIIADAEWKLVIPAESEESLEITLDVTSQLTPGRHVIPLWVQADRGLNSSDTFAVLEVD